MMKTNYYWTYLLLNFVYIVVIFCKIISESGEIR